MEQSVIMVGDERPFTHMSNRGVVEVISSECVRFRGEQNDVQDPKRVLSPSSTRGTEWGTA
jgi:hypothetical protein